ncbi:hypothetical protein ES703_78710 [subsurface metagenome]
MFSIITILSMLGLVFLLSFLYFRNKQERDSAGEDSADITLSGYFSWLFRCIPGLFRTAWIKRCWDLLQDRLSRHYQAGQRWIFICLGLSFLFQAAICPLAGLPVLGSKTCFPLTSVPEPLKALSLR